MYAAWYALNALASRTRTLSRVRRGTARVRHLSRSLAVPILEGCFCRSGWPVGRRGRVQGASHQCRLAVYIKVPVWTIVFGQPDPDRQEERRDVVCLRSMDTCATCNPLKASKRQAAWRDGLVPDAAFLDALLQDSHLQTAWRTPGRAFRLDLPIPTAVCSATWRCCVHSCAAVLLSTRVQSVNPFCPVGGVSFHHQVEIRVR
jgi:hypothetical protein